MTKPLRWQSVVYYLDALGTLVIYVCRLIFPFLLIDWVVPAIAFTGFYVACSGLSFKLGGPLLPWTSFTQRPAWWQLGLWLAAGPLIWLAISLIGLSMRTLGVLALMGLVLFLVSWFSSRLYQHHIQWLLAKPGEGKMLRSYLDRRGLEVPFHRLEHMWWVRTRLFGMLFFGLSIPIVAWLLHQSLPRPLSGAMAIFISFFLLGLSVIICVTWFYRTTGISLTRLWRDYWDALTTWINFDPHPFAPGVLRIPLFFDDLTHRHGRLTVISMVVIALVALVVPFGGYFPVTLIEPAPWLTLVPPPKTSPPASAEQAKYELLFRMPQVATQVTPQTLAQLIELQRLELDIRQQRADQKQIQAAMTDHLNTGAEAWVPLAIFGLTQKPRFFTLTLVLAAVLCMVVPLLFFVLLTFLYVAPPLVAIQLAASDPRGSVYWNPHEEPHDHPTSEESEEAPNVFTPSSDPEVMQVDATGGSDWDLLIERIQTSNNETERNSLWLGTHDTGQYPILLHRDALLEHGHIIGDSGSGKTAMALAPMISQLIRMAGRDQREQGINGEPASIMVLDLKGDPALFHNARLEAQRAGLPFRWCHSLVGEPTHVFNPFTQSFLKYLHPSSRTEIILDALSLTHGEGYGRSFYSRASRQVLSRFFQVFPDCQSFRELHEHLLHPERLGSRLRLTPKQEENAGELYSVIENLAAFDALNFSPGEALQQTQVDGADREKALEQAIDMGNVVTQPQVVYFYLPAMVGSASVREIAKLALFSLLAAASSKLDHQGRKCRVYLFVDEFQQIVGDNIKIILQQARSAGVAAMLANQTIGDLVTPQADLRPTLLGCTRFRQAFSVTDPQQMNIARQSSGETIDYIHAWSDSPSRSDEYNDAIRTSETVAPRITNNDIIAASDDDTKSIVHIPRGMGFAQFGGFPFIMKSCFHISKEEYDKRQGMPFPQDTPGVVTPNIFDVSPSVRPLKQTKRPSSSSGPVSPKGQDGTIPQPHLVKPPFKPQHAPAPDKKPDTLTPDGPSSASDPSGPIDWEQALTDVHDAVTNAMRQVPDASSGSKKSPKKSKRKKKP